MSSLEIELNESAVRELLKSDELKEFCEGVANAAIGRLGSGYEASTYIGKTRLNVSVMAQTREAREDNLNNNSILKALR